MVCKAFFFLREPLRELSSKHYMFMHPQVADHILSRLLEEESVNMPRFYIHQKGKSKLYVKSLPQLYDTTDQLVADKWIIEESSNYDRVGNDVSLLKYRREYLIDFLKNGGYTKKATLEVRDKRRVYLEAFWKRYPFINMGAEYPNNPFTAVIMFNKRSGFSYKPEEYLQSKTICVTDIIKNYKGKPEIVVDKEQQVKVQ